VKSALIVALVAAMAIQPLAARAQSSTPEPAASPDASAPAAGGSMLPIVVGAGAIAGVVAFNVLALGLEALPGGLAYEAGATAPADMSVAMSRVYAVTSAVVGGWVAYYLYEH